MPHCHTSLPSVYIPGPQELKGTEEAVSAVGGAHVGAGAGSGPIKAVPSLSAAVKTACAATDRVVEVKKLQYKHRIAQLKQDIADLHTESLVLRRKQVDFRKVHARMAVLHDRRWAGGVPRLVRTLTHAHTHMHIVWFLNDWRVPTFACPGATAAPTPTRVQFALAVMCACGRTLFLFCAHEHLGWWSRTYSRSSHGSGLWTLSDTAWRISMVKCARLVVRFVLVCETYARKCDSAAAMLESSAAGCDARPCLLS
jgi:hypothetical protein